MSRFTAGMKPIIATRDLDDEELETLTRELSQWSIPIAKPNEFEAHLRPSNFSHLPPLSVNEPAYSDVPQIFERAGLTLSCPFREGPASMGASDSIASNYSPNARSLDVHMMGKASRKQLATAKSLPSKVTAAPSTTLSQSTQAPSSLVKSSDRGGLISINRLMTKSSKNGTKFLTWDTNSTTLVFEDNNRLPPITSPTPNRALSRLLSRADENRPLFSRTRTGSDVKRSTPRHNSETAACLAITFPPWYTSTVGLSRPSTPVDRDLPRFYHLVDSAIDPKVVAPVADEWVANIFKLVPVELSSRFPRQTDEILEEARQDYNRAIRISVLNYILLDPLEQTRLGVTALPKPSVSAEPPVYPWRLTVQRIKGWMQSEFPTTLRIMQQIYQHTMKKYETFKLMDMRHFELEMPMVLGHFFVKAERMIARSIERLQNVWLEECCSIVHTFREEIETVMPGGNPEARQAKMDKVFAGISSAMSACLRQFITTTLNDMVAWFEQYSRGNNYRGEYNIFSHKFQPVRPVPFVILLNAPTNIDAKRVYTITPGFLEVEETLHALVDRIVESVQQLPRIEFRLFQVIEGLRIKYIRTVRGWEELVSQSKARISRVVNVNMPGPQRYKSTYEEFVFITSDEADEHISRFLTKPRPLAEIGSEIAVFQEITKRTEKLPMSVAFNFFQLDCTNINTWLTAKSNSYSDQLINFVLEKTLHHCHTTCSLYDKILRRLMTKMDSTDDYVSLQNYIENLNLIELERIKTEHLRRSSEHVLFMYDYKLLDKDQLHLITTTMLWPSKIKPLITQMEERLAHMLEQAMVNVRAKRKYVVDLIEVLAKRLKDFTARDKVNEAQQCCDELREINKSFTEVIEEKKFINHEELLLNAPEITPFNQILQLQMRKEPYEKLWNLALNCQRKNEAWMNGPITAVDPGKVEEEVDSLWREVYKLLKTFARNDTKAAFKVAQNAKSRLEKFKQYLPLITTVCNPGLKTRHWDVIYNRVGVRITLSDDMTLSGVVQQGLEKYLPVLQEVSSRATVEFALEKAIVKMKTDWENLRFEFVPYKNTGVSILTSIDEIQTLLEDHLLKTVAIKNSPFIAPFQAEIAEWDDKLEKMNAIMGSWVHVQSAWLYLVSIFSSANIRAQMPQEGEMFQQVDVSWRAILAESASNTQALAVVSQVDILDKLKEAEKQLNTIAKRLEDYLEGKRLFFPRFFFLSNGELLDILSEILNPLQVQPHLMKCFEGIYRVTFSERKTILGMESFYGEKVAFDTEIVPANANGLVEVWLQEVESMMQTTLREKLEQALDDHEKTERARWMTSWPGQVVLAVMALYWTSDVYKTIEQKSQSAFETLSTKYRGYVEDCVAKIHASETSKAFQMTLMSMVVLGVHWRDVIDLLEKKTCTDLNDFDWSAQMQYYFQKPGVVVQMITTNVPYGYEYQGNAQRLVVTPLTDRCHRTIMSALKLNLGGALEGPAGTGKTETVRDLSMAVAKRCLIFNCSEGVDYTVTAQFFKGLARLGAWACFDDFNRIHVEVLSVIAQQIQTIQRAVAERATTILFEGSSLELDVTCATFITFMPDYACRYELPDNLKALFRPIAMIVPNQTLIAEVTLQSMGFDNAHELAAKIVLCFKVISLRFSEQSHYENGLRGVKTALTAAGALKARLPKESEVEIVAKSITDSVLPKLIPVDVVVFNGIMADLFRGSKGVPNCNTELAATVQKLLTLQGYQQVPSFVDKVVQFYEILKVRHGIIVIGDTLSGKTTAIKLLASALADVNPDHHPVQYQFINPKSVSLRQLYGRFDGASHEWLDGILAKAFRDYSSNSQMDRKWIIFDGPVDPIWAENLNTVLDDNRKLCLISGEMIALNAQQTIMFEVQDLVEASPATVSRCGVIFLESTQIGYESMVASWVASQKFPPEHEKAINLLAKWLLPACLHFAAKLAVHYIKCQQMHLVASFLKLYETRLKAIRENAGDDNNEENDNALEELSDDAFVKLLQEQREKKLEAQYQNLVCEFLFSCIWSIGATLDHLSRAKFDEYFRELTEGSNVSYLKPPALRMQRNFLLPKNGKVFDYFYEPKQSADWLQWSVLIDANTAPISQSGISGAADFFVETHETAKLMFFLENLLERGKPVMFVGAPGTGKTTVTNFYLSDLDQAKFISNSVSLLAKTTVVQLSDILFSKLKRRDKGIYGPTSGHKMLLVVNDVNMPEKDAFGDQPTSEFLRQFLDHGVLFEAKDNSLVHATDITVCSSMQPPDNIRGDVTPRLLRHFNVIAIEPFSDDMITHIFTPILELHFGRSGFSPTFRSYVPMLVKATLETYKMATSTFLPTLQKCHYLFNLQDFSRLVKGLLLTKSAIFNTAEGDGKVKLTRMWVHEIYRTFYDRLSDDADRDTFFNSVKDICQRCLNERFSVIFAHLTKQLGSGVSDDDLRSLMFNSCMNSGENSHEYDEVEDFEQAQEAMERSVEEYNSGVRAPMPLVMFRFAIEHISRICRVLQQPGGHCLLIGMGGSGRQSLAKLATYVSGFELFQIEITKSFSINDWRKGIRKLLRRAGDDGKKIVFLFNDYQIKEDWFLEDIGLLLNSGDIPGIFEGEERRDIIENMNILYRNDFAAVDVAPAQLYSLFVNRVKQNLHVVLTLSPVGKTFRSRVQRFPSLVTCCTIDWFHQWPDDAYELVANRQLDAVEMPPNVRTNIITLCDRMHKSVVNLSEKFWEITRSRIFITPTYFLELLKSYKILVQKRQYDLLTLKERYLTGLERIEQSGKQIEVMRIELAEIPPLLERTTLETNDLIRVIQTETDQVEAKKRVVEADEAAANSSAEEARAIKGECETALAEALPALKSAIASLNTLNSSHISVVKTMQKPPVGVRLVMEAVCVMKGIKPAKYKDENGAVVEDYWPEARKMLNDMKFLDTLREYDKDNIPPGIIKTIREKYVANPEFDPNVIKNISSACEGLCKWIRAMEEYDRVASAIAPRRRSLKIAETQLAEQTAKLKQKRAEMKILEEKLAVLKGNYQAKIDEKLKLESNIDNCHLKIARAEKLIAGLGGERERWLAIVDDLTKAHDSMIGDALLAVGVVTYLGAFSTEFRQRCVDSWHKKSIELAIPCSAVFNFSAVLGDPILIREWQLNGLPVDTLSTENGIVMQHASRWPLIIDPQGVANRWIKKTEKANRLAVIKLSDPSYLQTLEACIQFGTPCLLENVGEDIDPVLEPLLTKSMVKENGIEYLRIGDHLVEYSKEFRFYMTTRLRNPYYLPEIAIKVTLINFKITPSALQNQMLSIVVAQERPQLEEKKNTLIVESATNKRRLKEMEERTLEILSSSEGNILEDEEAIDLMTSSDALMAKIASEQEVATLTEQETDEVRNGYSPVASHSSTIFFTISSLAAFNHMYQWRLTWFTRMFLKSIQETPPSDVLAERIKRLNTNFTLRIFKHVATALFEKDKLLVPFLLTVNLQIDSGIVDMAEWRFLLSAPMSPDTLVKNPAPEWLAEKSWLEIIRASSLKGFDGLMHHVKENRTFWQRFFSSSEPRDDEIPSPYNETLTPFQKLVIVRLFRPEKVLAGVRRFVASCLGVEFVESPTLDLLTCFSESSPTAPIIYILSPGSDPMATIYKFANERGYTGNRLQIVSLGRGQGAIAERTVLESAANGSWVVLQNCHLAPSWLPELERLFETVLADPEKTNRDFRMWLTTFPCSDFPASILQNGVKIVDDSPKTLRANMLKSYTGNPLISDTTMFESSKHPVAFKRLLYGLVFFHGVVQVRRKFGSLGWNVPYDFNDSDLSISVQQLMTFINNQPDNPPVEGLTYLISECNYGGRVTDEWDRRLVASLFEKYFNHKTYLENEYKMTEDGVECEVPVGLTYDDFIRSVKQQPRFASPSFFGLHENANIVRHKNEINVIFESILQTLPREVVTGSRNHQQTIAKLATDLLARLPPEFRLENVQTHFPVRQEEALNAVLIQEVTQYNQLTLLIRRTLGDLQKAFRNLIVMSPEMEETSEALLTGHVPKLWLRYSYPSTKPLGSYVNDLLARLEFFRLWTSDTSPKIFWLSSFFFPNAFLTAVLQNHARRSHLPFSDVDFEFEFFSQKAPEVAKKPPTGAFIEGLFLDGAGWSVENQTVTEARPYVLQEPMPIIWLKPGDRTKFEAKQFYKCPVYKSSVRWKPSKKGGSNQFIMSINLPIDRPEQHWINRAVALLCQLDN